MVQEARQENALFADKSKLDGSLPGAGPPVGRDKEVGELVRALAGGRGYVAPFVFVYGRTGSGKSTVVKFVCERLPFLAFRMANLRKARTVFGCASLIQEELGGGEAKRGQSCSSLLQKISSKMGELASQSPFVLVLDEFDSLFSDRRGCASDFVYRLLAEQQRLREEGRMVCIIAIANSPAEMDERVKSRIGSAPEIYFGAYGTDEVHAILKDRAGTAFAEPVDERVLGYCAAVSSEEFGDARRAIDLLRAAAELAGPEGRIEKKHVDGASDRLQKNRVKVALEAASFQLTIVCRKLVRLTLFSGPAWHSTSRIYDHYSENIIRKNEGSRLGYRRVAELLGELYGLGLVESRAGSKGRRGFGREYRLAMPPDAFTDSFPGLRMEVLNAKQEHERLVKEIEERSESYRISDYERQQAKERLEDEKRWWKEYYAGA
jgi:cell division control protein 6